MEVALLGAFLNTYLPKIWAALPDEKKQQQKLLEAALGIQLLKQDLRLLAANIQDHESSGMDSGQTAWIIESRRLAQDIQDHIEISLHSGDSSSYTKTITDHLRERLTSIKVDPPKPTSGAPVIQTVPDLPAHMEHKEEPLKELLKFVYEDEEPRMEAGKMKVIAIVGFGGLGKTTRAVQVFQSVEDKKQFEARVWVRAEGMSADDILKVIWDKLKQNSVSTSSAGQQDITDFHRIKTCLQNKRYFIVIDDMREPEQWQKIEHAFPRKLSSRIIVTTAIQSVARACWNSGGYVYKLLPLRGADSKNLLLKPLSGTPCEDAAKHAEELVKICEGLPLALISLSQYFQNNTNGRGLTQRTCRVAYSELGECLMGEKGGLDEIRQVLVDIYNALDHRRERRGRNNGLDRHILKACLLYFSMFLDNEQPTRNHLVRRWVAEGFSSEDDAIKNLVTLTDRNVIQAMEVCSDGDAKKCQPPGMMLKYITRKATSENFVTLSSAEKMTNGPTNGFNASEASVRRLCVNPDNLEDGKRLASKDLSLLRALQVSGQGTESILKFGGARGKNYKLLRVLELKKCDTVVECHLLQICEHFPLLRYLSLGVGIVRIPRSIVELKMLETLYMSRRTNPVAVPFELILLPSLTHLIGKFQLYKDDYKKLNRKNKNKSESSKLQRLSGFVASAEEFDALMPLMRCLRKIKIWCTSADKTLPGAIKKFISEGQNALNDDRSLSVEFSECSNLFGDSESYPGRLTSLKLKGKMESFPQSLGKQVEGIEKLCLSSPTPLRWVLIQEGLAQFRDLIYLKLSGDDLSNFSPDPKDAKKEAPRNAPSASAGVKKPFGNLRRICFSVTTNLPQPAILDYLPALTDVYLYSDSIVTQGDTRCSWEDAAKKHPGRPMLWFGPPPQAS